MKTCKYYILCTIKRVLLSQIYARLKIILMSKDLSFFIIMMRMVSLSVCISPLVIPLKIQIFFLVVLQCNVQTTIFLVLIGIFERFFQILKAVFLLFLSESTNGSRSIGGPFISSAFIMGNIQISPMRQ